MTDVDAGGGDRLALAVLAQYRMVTTEQMHLILSPGVRIEQTRRRLAKLRAEGLVDRITLPQRGRLRGWFPTQYGVQVACEWPELRGRRPSKTVSDRTAARLRVGHALTVTETGLAFLKDARRRGELCRPLDWIPEVYHPIGSGEAVIPDALMFYRRGRDGGEGAMLRAFVEVDRATMGPERLAAKLTAYARLYDYMPAHVRLVAQALGKSERTVWRWLAAARQDHRLARVESSHFTVTTEVRRLLALWGGNASRVHAELMQRAADDPDAPAVPSLSTLHRAIRRDLTRGERAGLKSGEAARRAHDVFGQRSATHRNAVWEGDHKHVPVEVDVEGELATPWVTWFIDCATKAIAGVAVTAHAPSRDAVLASLRIAITRGEPFGPVGGLPGQIRVDRGKEFLCQAVTAAMGALAVPVTDLPAYSPHLKGTIKALNDAVEETSSSRSPATPAVRSLTAAGSPTPMPHRSPMRRSWACCWTGRAGGTPATVRPR
ncbi:replication-relaxation family protein [Streptomyces sp. NPDC001312]|uniref:replication-relaxation family protein n=1 Tax=Streptomyces sp. NPDC001312 TaxID=3364561 RepID=UPI0036B7CCAE